MKLFDEKLKKLLIILGVIIVVLIIGALIINMFKGTTLTYDQMEDKLVSAAKNYYNNHKDLLPVDYEDSVDVDSSVLASEGYMKELSEYNSASCSGSVTVTKSGSGYNYIPYLNCGSEFTTKYLYEKVLEDVVEEGTGLYKTTESLGEVYIYRGEYPNNYVSLDKEIWRIVKVNPDNTIVIIQANNNYTKYAEVVWDNRYNIEVSSNSGINDYEVSRINRTLDKYYESDKYFTNELKSKVVKTKFCVAGRHINDTKNDGSIECSKLSEPHYFGLLPAYDLMNASLDSHCDTIESKNCGNYNYLFKYDRTWWLATTNSANTYRGYKTDGSTYRATLSDRAYARIVTTLSNSVRYSKGDGTVNNPYILK